MIARSVAAALLTFLPSLAMAEAVPRAEATLSGATVTVGDVFDGAGDAAARFLAPSPKPGESLVLGAGDLQRVSNAFGLGWRSETGAERVVLHAPFDGIDRYEIEAALQDKVSDEMPGQVFEIALTGGAVSIPLPAGAQAEVEVRDFTLDAARRGFVARLEVPGFPKAGRDVAGRIVLLTQVPVLKNALRPGDVIGPQDLSYVEMRETELPGAALLDAEDLAGRTPRRGLAAMKPVLASDLVLPPVVKKGDLVTVALADGPIALTLQGRALQNGAEGEVIRVANTVSNKIVDAVVTGAQAVRVKPASSAL